MKKSLLLLFLVLIISFFFRTYQFTGRLSFDHDGDLSAWIVKDIVVNHHFRLIGQLTSAPGIFIGPFYYYALVPFYLITNMDPVGGAILITLIGLLTTLSFYFVFRKLFNPEAGLIAAFLQASLISSVNFDRLPVPSTPSNLWIIWYFYTIVRISQGNYSVLPLLGILTGLVWHIHIALAPTLLAAPVAFIVSRKLPKLKQVLWAVITLIVTSSPFLIFEFRHHFSQTISFIQNFAVDHGGGKGLPKLIYILEMISKNINTLFLSPQSLPILLSYFLTLAILITSIFLVIKKTIPVKLAIPFIAWAFGVIAFFTFSSSLVSEYYLYSLDIIFIATVSLIFSKLAKPFLFILLSIILVKNIFYFINFDIYHKGYVERKAIADYITRDAKLNNYPCVGISYITTPGENVGFRYFFYLNNLHLIHPSLEIPVYNIVIPDELALGKVTKKFGHIGIIPPEQIPAKEVIEKSCQSPNTNLTDTMFGYVD